MWTVFGGNLVSDWIYGDFLQLAGQGKKELFCISNDPPHLKALSLPAFFSIPVAFALAELEFRHNKPMVNQKSPSDTESELQFYKRQSSRFKNPLMPSVICNAIRNFLKQISRVFATRKSPSKACDMHSFSKFRSLKIVITLISYLYFRTFWLCHQECTS